MRARSVLEDNDIMTTDRKCFVAFEDQWRGNTFLMSPVAASGGMTHAAVWKKAKALGMFGNLGRAVYEENLLYILCTYVQPR